MPYKIFKGGGKHCVHKLKADGSKGEVVKCHDSESKAKAHMKALYANVKASVADIVAKTYSKEQRDKMAKEGTAMKDGSYPIADKADLKNAIQAFGRSKSKTATKRHIIKRAKALGATDMLPQDWNVSASIPLSSLEYLMSDPEAVLPIEMVNDIIRAAASHQTEDGEALLVDIDGVEILKTGIEYDLASGPATFTPEDLVDAAAAPENPNISNPRIGLGHDGPVSAQVRNSDEPAVGTVHNLRVTEDGQTLLGDFKGVPVWLADILASAYPSRSVRAQFNREVNGHKYRLVINSVDLLGVVWPGCTSIEDIQALYSKEGPEGIEVIEAKEGESMPREVAASVGSEDVRRAFYETVATGDRAMWWLTAHYEMPPVLIAEDADGQIWSISYSFNGDEVVFDDPVAVVRQYVEEESGKVTADQGDPVAVFASRAESVPENTNQEDRMDAATIKLLRTRLGVTEEQLPDDASQEQIANVLAQAPETEPEKPEGEEQEKPEAEKPEKPAEEEPAKPEAEKKEPVAASAADDGTVKVDKETWTNMVSAANGWQEFAKKQNETDRDNVIAEAVKVGKFPPSRSDHYKTSWEADPEGTRQIIASLSPGLVPVEARATSSDEQFTGDDEAYPAEWVPEVQAAAAGNNNGRRTVTVGED